jgi:hypothetical protein
MVICTGLHQKRYLERYRGWLTILEQITVKMGDFTVRNRSRDKDLKQDLFVHE